MKWLAQQKKFNFLQFPMGKRHNCVSFPPWEIELFLLCKYEMTRYYKKWLDTHEYSHTGWSTLTFMWIDKTGPTGNTVFCMSMAHLLPWAIFFCTTSFICSNSIFRAVFNPITPLLGNNRQLMSKHRKECIHSIGYSDLWCIESKDMMNAKQISV